MMGYTHAAIGAAGGISIAILLGNGTVSPELYTIATVSGIIGGVAVDADVVDQKEEKRITDGSRSRLAVIGILIAGLLLDACFNKGTIFSLLSQPESVVGAIIGFLVIFLIAHLVGRFVGHRTFSHSLLFIILTSSCVYYVYPDASIYFFIGAILHILFDLLNNQAPNNDGSWHGIWLFYPIKRGNGIALRKCKAFGKGNTALYFIAIILFIGLSVLCFSLMKDVKLAISPIILLIFTVIVLHFVRRKSEKEMAA